MPIRHETELYAPVKRFLEERGYTVKSEVNGCDLVAYPTGDAAGEPVIVELKRTFQLGLVLQAMKRQSLTASVYAAVEYRKRAASGGRWRDILELCRRLGIGLLGVTFYSKKKPFVEVLCEPYAAGLPPKSLSKLKRARMAQEFAERSGDYNVGGATRVKLVTAYREKALAIAQCLAEHGPLSPRELRERTGSSKAAAILQRNVYGWFRRIERGVYGLTESGQAGLKEFAEVVTTSQTRSTSPDKVF